jgi:hypothetical protein
MPKEEKDKVATAEAPKPSVPKFPKAGTKIGEYADNEDQVSLVYGENGTVIETRTTPPRNGTTTTIHKALTGKHLTMLAQK